MASMKEHSYNTKIAELEAQLSRATSSAAHLKRAKEEVTITLGIPHKIQNGLTTILMRDSIMYCDVF